MLHVEHLASAHPCKALSWRLQVIPQDCRIFSCGRCHRNVVICRQCDRGNRYCPPCAPLARAEKQRAAGALYQKTEAGRLNHKARQEHYRGRQAEKATPLRDWGKEAPQILPIHLQREAEKVTHHGDLGAALRRNSAYAALRGGQESEDERREEPQEPRSMPQRRCDFCGRPCSCAVRTGRVPRRPFSYRRGPRLPGHMPGRRRC